jgi:hypothetical protein
VRNLTTDIIFVIIKTKNPTMKPKAIFLFVLACAAFTTVSATEKPSTPAAPPADSAVIYIYRVGQFMGAGANWSMFVNEDKLCKLSNNKFMRVVVKPGKHTISSRIGGVGLFKKRDRSSN